MPSSRRVAAVLLALAVTGCTADAAPEEDTASTGTPGDGGAFDAVVGQEALPPLTSRHSIRATALDPDGNTVVLANQIAGDAPLLLLRAHDGEWTDLPLTDQNTLGFSADMRVARDGTAVVTGYADRVFSITRVTHHGEVSTVPVAADLDPDRIGTLNTAVASAGDLARAPSTRGACSPASPRPPAPPGGCSAAATSTPPSSGCTAPRPLA